MHHLVDGHAGKLGREGDDGRVGLAPAEHVGLDLATLVESRIRTPHRRLTGARGIDHATTGQTSLAWHEGGDPAVQKLKVAAGAGRTASCAGRGRWWGS